MRYKRNSISESKIARNTTMYLENESVDRTRKLEHERRISIILDKDLEEHLKQLDLTKQKTAKLINKDWNYRGLKKISLIEGKLNQATVELSEIRSLTKHLDKKSVFSGNKNISTLKEIKILKETSKT